MNQDIEEPDKDGDHALDRARQDYVALAARGALSLVPFVGSLLVEIAGVVIPNQRTDRIAKFAEQLEARLDLLEKDFVRSQLGDEEFTDLMEEGVRQAARSLSDERRAYIASLIASSLSSEDIEYQESKHLMRILGELNDVEVVWLRSLLHPVRELDGDFYDRHAELLAPVAAHEGSGQEEFDKSTLQKSYKEHLARLGLLRPNYKVDRKTGQVETDKRTGHPKVGGYEITPFGRLLLREIGLSE